MALKPDRHVLFTDISYFMLSTGERGGVVCAVTGFTPGSGAAMDYLGQRVAYTAQPSGYQAVGLLLTDIVNIDQSRQFLNPYKSESQVGDKVLLLKRGWVVTNFLTNTANLATGDMPCDAWLGPTGTLTNINPNQAATYASGYVFSLAGTAVPRVGKFLSRKDSDGYAKVYIEL